MEKQSLNQAIESLPLSVKWVLGGLLFLGGIMTAINSGWLSWAGVKAMSVCVFLLAMFLFAVAKVDESTREYFWSVRDMIVGYLLAMATPEEKDKTPA